MLEVVVEVTGGMPIRGCHEESVTVANGYRALQLAA
jgi:hypothetical protein